MTVKSKKKYPTVKATNGALFELRENRMVQINRQEFDPKRHAHTLEHRATRSAIRQGLLGDSVKTTSWADSWRMWRTSRWDHDREDGSALALGCMNFSKVRRGEDSQVGERRQVG